MTTRAGWLMGAAGAAMLALPALAQDRIGSGSDIRETYGRDDGAYPPLERGQRLSPAFQSPGYLVRDAGAWGLPPASTGLRWVRYWDDAALIDRDGVVRDVRTGIGWDARAGDSYAAANRDRRLPYDEDVLRSGDPVDQRNSYGSAYGDDRGVDEDRYAYARPEARYRDRYDRRGYDPRCFDDRAGRDDAATVAGAVGGAVIGGIAGNVIAGRGDRTAGTLIGGGLGAVAGGVAGRELGRDRSPIGPCPDDHAPRTRGYPDGLGRTVTYGPGGGTTTVVTTGGTTTTTVVEEFPDSSGD